MTKTKYLTIHITRSLGWWKWRLMGGDELLASGTKRTQAEARKAANEARDEHVRANGQAWKQFQAMTHSGGGGWKARHQARKTTNMETSNV